MPFNGYDTCVLVDFTQSLICVSSNNCIPSKLEKCQFWEASRLMLWDDWHAEQKFTF